MNSLSNNFEEDGKVDMVIEEDKKVTDNILDNPLNKEKLLVSNKRLIIPSPVGFTNPCEEIGKNTKIMTHIIRYLTNPKDRKNLEMVSKKFYTLCNDLNSYIPLSTSETITTQLIMNDRGGFSFIIFSKEIVLYAFKIPVPINDITHNWQTILRGMFNKFAPHMNSLSIVIMVPGYQEIFKNLNCFGNIKTVKIDVNSLKKYGINIFSRCPSLKPVNLCITNLSFPNVFFTDNQMFHFPSSVKNIYFESDPTCLKWLLSQMPSFGNGCFEYFSISQEAFSRIEVCEHKMSFLNIVPYFKKINYFAYDFIGNGMDKCIAKILEEHNITSVVNIQFSPKKFDSTILNNPTAITIFDVNHEISLSNSAYRFLSQPGIYLNISKLSINDFYNTRNNHPLSCFEIKYLTEDISRMKKLIRLDVDLHLFKIFPDFVKFCCGINSEIKYLKIGRCSTIMAYYFPVIKLHFKKLEYLYLENVGPYTTVTLKNVLEQMNYIKGLKIIFNSFYNVKNILKDLEKTVNGVGTKQLAWPNIDFLNIIFTCSNNEYQEILSEIEKNTPRRIGMFIFKNAFFNGKMYYQIIIQRHTSFFDKFEKAFELFC